VEEKPATGAMKWFGGGAAAIFIVFFSKKYAILRIFGSFRPLAPKNSRLSAPSTT